MADDRIKKIIVPKASLPPLLTNDDGSKSQYIVRYRIVSEDRNRVSHWSPQHTIQPQPVFIEESSNIVTINNNTAILIWQIPEGTTIPNFDIYAAWGSDAGGTGVGTPEYVATVSGNSAIIPIPAGTLRARFSIQFRTSPKRRVESATIAQSTIVTL